MSVADSLHKNVPKIREAISAQSRQQDLHTARAGKHTMGMHTYKAPYGDSKIQTMPEDTSHMTMVTRPDTTRIGGRGTTPTASDKRIYMATATHPQLRQ